MTTLPGVAQRIYAVVSDETSELDDLVSVVQQDPALALRVLRVANSPALGLRRSVNDLKSAIGYLGYDRIRSLAMTVCMARMCGETDGYRCFNVLGLWRNLVATANVARLISIKCDRADPEEAYLAGLLHNVGLLLLWQYVRLPFQRLVDAVLQGADQLEAEKSLLTFTHAELGAFIAQSAGLSERFCAALAFHHNPLACPHSDTELLDVLVAASYLATRNGYAAIGFDDSQLPPIEVLSRLGIAEGHVELINRDLKRTLDLAEVLAAI